MQGWHIYDGDNYIDTVFYIKSMSADEVKTSLIQREMLRCNITVIKSTN